MSFKETLVKLTDRAAAIKNAAADQGEKLTVAAQNAVSKGIADAKNGVLDFADNALSEIFFSAELTLLGIGLVTMVLALVFGRSSFFFLCSFVLGCINLGLILYGSDVILWEHLCNPQAIASITILFLFQIVCLSKGLSNDRTQEIRRLEKKIDALLSKSG